MTSSLAAIQLKAPTYVVGLLLSLYALLPMLLSVTIGRWIDRVGTRLPMLLGSGLVAIGFATPAIWLSLEALYVNSVCVGLGFIGFHMCIQKLTGELADGPERMRNFGMLSVGYSISGFSGPIVAGFMIDHAGAGSSFGASFGASTVLVAAAFALLKWHWRFDGRSAPVGQAAPVQGNVLELLRTPRLRRLYVAVVMVSSAWDVLMFLVPIHGSKIGLSASEIGTVLGAFAAATFVVRMALPLIVSRLTEWQMIGIVHVVAALVYTVFPLVTSHIGLMVLAAVLGLGLGVGQPAIMSLLHHESPPGRVGEAVGLRMTLINTTQTVLPTAFGSAGSVLSLFFTGSLTFAPLFWGVALMLGVGTVNALRPARAPDPAKRNLE